MLLKVSISAGNIDMLKYFFREMMNSNIVLPNQYTFSLLATAFAHWCLYDQIYDLSKMILREHPQADVTKLHYHALLSLPKKELKFSEISKDSPQHHHIHSFLEQALKYNLKNTLKLLLEANLEDLTKNIKFPTNSTNFTNQLFNNYKNELHSTHSMFRTTLKLHESLVFQIITELKL